MNKKTIITVFLIIAVTLFIIVLAKVITTRKINQPIDINSTSTAYSLYYRDDCPHCKNVEKFLAENKVEEKIKIEHKEIMKNIKYNNEIMTRAANCGLDLKTVGVPLVYDAGKCYVGDEEIINFFKSKL